MAEYWKSSPVMTWKNFDEHEKRVELLSNVEARSPRLTHDVVVVDRGDEGLLLGAEPLGSPDQRHGLQLDTGSPEVGLRDGVPLEAEMILDGEADVAQILAPGLGRIDDRNITESLRKLFGSCLDSFPGGGARFEAVGGAHTGSMTRPAA
jgi:hypothetical protein